MTSVYVVQLHIPYEGATFIGLGETRVTARDIMKACAKNQGFKLRRDNNVAHPNESWYDRHGNNFTIHRERVVQAIKPAKKSKKSTRGRSTRATATPAKT